MSTDSIDAMESMDSMDYMESMEPIDAMNSMDSTDSMESMGSMESSVSMECASTTQNCNLSLFSWRIFSKLVPGNPPREETQNCDLSG